MLGSARLTHLVLPLVLASGCAARSHDRVDTTPFGVAAAHSRPAAAASPTNTLTLPGDFDMSWASPTDHVLYWNETKLPVRLRAQNMAKNGKLVGIDRAHDAR